MAAQIHFQDYIFLPSLMNLKFFAVFQKQQIAKILVQHYLNKKQANKCRFQSLLILKICCIMLKLIKITFQKAQFVCKLCFENTTISKYQYFQSKMIIIFNIKNNHWLNQIIKVRRDVQYFQLMFQFIIYLLRSKDYYNLFQTFMKNITLIAILVLLISESLAQFQVIDIVGPYENRLPMLGSPRFYGCYNLGGSVDPNAIQTLQNAKNAGLGTHGYMVLCRNGDPNSHVDAVLNAIPHNLMEALWFKVVPNSTPGCLWSDYSHADNCAFLTQALNHFHSLISYGMTSGVFSTASIWNRFFVSSCNTISTHGILWYAYYNSDDQVNSVESFADFTPFGGFQGPYLKQIAGSVKATFCFHPKWHAFFNINMAFS